VRRLAEVVGIDIDERGDRIVPFSRVSVRLLGPLTAFRAGMVVPIGSAKQRILLAVLGLQPHQLVSTAELIDALWGDRPPDSCRGLVHTYVSRLRHTLGMSETEDTGSIVARHGGYELRLSEDQLDVLRFRRLAATAQHPGTRDQPSPQDEADLLARALRCWQGPLLHGMPDRLRHHPVAVDTTRMRVDLAVRYAELSAGGHDRPERMVAVLQPIAHDEPLHEAVQAHLMLALAASGQQAAALALFDTVRTRLADDLGVDPSPVLQTALQTVLHQAVPPTPRPPARLLDADKQPDPTTVPAQLPPNTRGFVSRAAELAALPAAVTTVPHQLPPLLGKVTGRDELLGAILAYLLAGTSVADSGIPRVAILAGPGGVGKTCLALAAGHELGSVFPDGQLFADLHGSTESPADPHAVLGRFLRALGVDGSALPDDRDERIAMYRSRLAGTRTLVVLDDAGSEEQLRPLLPGSAPCGALITSRRQLGALMTPSRWAVPVLSPEHAVELLARTVGADRVNSELAAAAAVSELCGRLPLAVSIAGARLAAHPDSTFAEFRQRLADERSRLDELTVGDLDVRASIALSYNALTPELRRLFRRLGLVATPDFPAWVAHELIDDLHTGRMLEALAEVHMVQPTGRDVVGQTRFRLHDLVRDFARERAHAEEDPRALGDAVSRILSGWLALISHADELIDHGAQNTVALAVPPLPRGAALPDRATVLAWCEWERTNLTTAVDLACQQRQTDIAGKLALRLSGFLMLRAYGDDRDRILHNAIASVGEHGDHHLLLRLLNAQFLASLQRSRNAELSDIAERELRLARQLREPEWLAAALHHAGVGALMTSRFTDSARWFTEAVDVARTGRLPGRLIARSLRGLADVRAEAGDAEASLPLFEEARTIQDEEGRSRGTAILLRRYGMALLDAGRPDAAEDVIAEGIRVAREIGDEFGVATIEQTFADVEIHRGRLTQAAARLNRLLTVHDSLAHREGVAAVLRSLADLATVENRWPDAVSLLCRAIDIRRQLSQPLDIARLLARLAHAHTVIGDATAAATCRTEYQRILADLQLDPHCLFRPPEPVPPGPTPHAYA
jgi:DNA-binding SARP family transcriptional activator/tetratricopeptide (TPR) repeat protein